ncbi:ABC transporter A family member 1 isoform X2 [Magnolia sinica]|uniref:ABC transporter A family member 1 isoform X2 n=1 Tax=Magnolia sinica TaxID=86752 RepID=UPI00265B68BC|nr:ABC transporter A family member 1 isoform X2 [Magnolia sinica]
MGGSQRQLKAMLRKNWLLKIRHPFTTFTEILLPTVVMLLLIAVRTRVDTRLHPAQPYIRKGMYVEVGKSDISPSFESILELLYASGEHLAFAPDTEETTQMLGLLSLRFPLLKVVGKIYKDELELETYIRSDLYGVTDQTKNCSNPKIRGAIIFHEQGPQVFDYSIRLNHTWAFSGFPDVKTIMDTNGPFVNDLELGVSAVPTLQYGFSGFLTLQQVLDSFIIFASQQNETIIASGALGKPSLIKYLWTRFNPSNIRIAPFPTRAYTDDEFQSIIKKVMGVLYLLGFLHPISRLISCAVFEKEQKIKEGLRMMGLHDEIFYLSWFITYVIQFAVTSGVITACTMSSLFMYSDKSVVFMYFFLFGLSAIMLSFLISTFFSRAKAAVAVGTLSFLGAFFPYYTVNDTAVPMTLKVLASLLSPTAFALGTVNFADYERAHVGVRWSNIWQASSGVNFLVCLLMMMLDTVLYCAIGLYLDKVLPRENGVRQPWNFLFKKCFWGKKSIVCQNASNVGVKVGKNKATFANKDGGEPAIEAISLDMKQQELDSRCIQIRNLHKVYMTRKGKCCAVNSLQLSLYENQILALLGHNGAGKSTTISMLVGLLPPTSGDALVFGRSIRTDMVKEHLEIFAVLKGVEEELLETKVHEMVDEVGLADKVNTVVGALSGGMKRKLSLGIALIGHSKVIILDEPTSGMDPYSMRSTWQLIKKIKKGRIILLTTHSMDEADVLGDRIAIMANGSLRCCGSSLFLKHRYGVGYTLTLVKAASSASVAADIVHRHVPSATRLSDVGTEVSFRLPLASSSAFEGMFREIESCIKRPGTYGGSSSNEDECSFGIESYGISVTTLEEVFLRVAGCDFTEIENIDHNKAHSGPDAVVSEAAHHYPQKKAPDFKLLFWNYKKLSGMIFSTVARVCSIIFTTFFSFITFLNVQCCGCGIITRSTFLQHSSALLKKRAISARRDRRTVVFQLLIPAVFLFFGLLFLKLKPHSDQQSVTLTTSHFNPLLRGGGGGGPIPFNLSFPISEKVASYIKGGWIQRLTPRMYKFPDPEKALGDAIYVAGPVLGPILISMSEYLITSLNESYQSRYGAIVMDDQNDDGSLGYTVLHNSTCQHAAPTFINLMNSAILRLATENDNMTIQTRNHPLPMTSSQHSQHHDLDAFSAAIIVTIAFSFIPASFAVAIVKEREVKAKHQQLISGVSILSYWFSTYIWDFISFLFPVSFAVILFYIFGLDQFVGSGCLLPTIFLFLEYGLAVAASTYCLTFFFSDHTVAQNVVLLVHFFSGLILMVISFIMGLVQATKSANSFLKNFFRLAPGFCFADGLASLALRRQGMKLGSGNETLDWNITGASIFYLAVESIIYFVLTIVLELLPPQKLNLFTIKGWWRRFRTVHHGTSESYLEPLLNSFSKNVALEVDEDTDVQAERQRVLSGSVDNAIIYLRNLRKVYPGGVNHPSKVAVQSLTFSVQEGECFGFLGTNGAGKTTTLSMLTGEDCPSDGTAYIFGSDICLNPRAARQHIGYCPQFDALLEFLTVQEHLELYARIKGVPEMRMRDVVEEKLMEFDLWKHANKPSYSLSGGNKRKLSVAIAMIGDPPIVILDEPSTGMDPIAKRFMWEVIARLSTRQGKTAVILTTHSMNEAQALCTRIGIMVAGRLRCIGSPQHLKRRFGNHLELEVKPTEVSCTELDKLCRRIQETLFDFPCHPRSIIGDLEVCIGASDSIASDNIAEISLSQEVIIAIGRWLGNEESIRTLVSSTPFTDGVFGEQLSEQLIRDGGIPLRIFSEWWLAKEKFSVIDSFILSSFPGATFQGCNGLSVKYQLPYNEDSSLADIFGHFERNRVKLGVAEYSISQSTLETIFNHFAANP